MLMYSWRAAWPWLRYVVCPYRPGSQDADTTVVIYHTFTQMRCSHGRYPPVELATNRITQVCFEPRQGRRHMVKDVRSTP
jgi:hypothetical protein